jgi:hypothetical protein
VEILVERKEKMKAKGVEWRFQLKSVTCVSLWLAGETASIHNIPSSFSLDIIRTVHQQRRKAHVRTRHKRRAGAAAALLVLVAWTGETMVRRRHP